MVRINDLKQKLIITAALLTVVTVMYFAHIPCPILRLTGFECPGCGMTRALAAALRLDFSSAFSYHMMFWSVPVLYLCFLFDGRLFSKKMAEYTFVFVADPRVFNKLYNLKISERCCFLSKSVAVFIDTKCDM